MLVETYHEDVDKCLLVINSALTAGMSWDNIAEMVTTQPPLSLPPLSLPALSLFLSLSLSHTLSLSFSHSFSLSPRPLSLPALSLTHLTPHAW